jgi:hypothetical protein
MHLAHARDHGGAVGAHAGAVDDGSLKLASALRWHGRAARFLGASFDRLVVLGHDAVTSDLAVAGE